MIKPKIVGAITGGALLLGVLTVGAGVINAQTAPTTTTQKNPMSSLVTAIAQKFNLNVSDVQSVVDQTMEAERADMEAKQQQAQADRLAQVVSSGKLTEAQADLITAKAAELKTTRESDRTADQSLTAAERKTKMEAEQTALKTWATDNNIPVEYLNFLGGGRGFGGPGGHGGPRPGNSTATPTTSSTTTS